MRTPRASSIPAPVDTDGLLRRIVSAVGRKIDDFAHHTPSRFAVIIFTSIFLLWTTIYMLPISSADGTVTPFHEALFTAVSTICVTGLSVVDMATHWSGFGHFMVFLGMQVGAIGVLTLASIMGAIVTRRLGLRQKLVAASDSNALRTHAGPVSESQAVKLGDIGAVSMRHRHDFEKGFPAQIVVEHCRESSTLNARGLQHCPANRNRFRPGERAPFQVGDRRSSANPDCGRASGPRR